REERLEALLGLDGAELGDVGRAALRVLEADRVGDAHAWDRRAEELGLLGEGAADGDSPRAGAAAGEARRRRELGVDRGLPAGEEIVDGVLLLRLLAGNVPVLAEVPAAARVRLDEDAALLHEGEDRRREKRLGRDAVGAVAVDERRVRAVTHEPLLRRDR